jgi:hypothetical protein
MISPLKGLWRVYNSWKSWILTAAIALVYYLLFRYLVTLSNHGILFLSVPAYLIYALDILASILITSGIYSIVRTTGKRRVSGSSSGFVSAASILAAGISVGCACQAPILYSILYLVGLNSIEASGIVVTIVDYNIEILWLLVLINLIMIFIVASRIKDIRISKN